MSGHSRPPNGWRAVIETIVAARAHGEEIVRQWESLTAGLRYTPLEVVSYLEKRKLWHYDDLIRHLIRAATPLEDQYEFIVKVAATWGPRGFFRIWGTLTDVATSDPTSATLLLRRLLEENPQGAAYATSALLLGIAMSESQPTLTVIKDAIRSTVPHSRTAGLCALSDLIRKTNQLTQSTIAAVETIADPTNELEAGIMLDIFERVASLGGPPMGERILRIARSGSTVTLKEAIRISTDTFASDEAFLRELFEIASANPEALRGFWSGRFMGLIYSFDPDAVLRVIGSVSEQTSLVDSFYDGANEFLDAVGKSDRERFFDAIGEWLNRRNSRLLIQAPALVARAFKGNEDQLVVLLRKWEYGESPQFLVRLETLREVLSEASIEKKPAFGAIVQSVEELADSASVNRQLALQGETDPRFRALRLVDALLNPPPPIDPVQIKRSMGFVPSLVRFVQESFIVKELKKGASDHPLIRMLAVNVPSSTDVEAAIGDLSSEEEPNRLMAAWARARQMVKLFNHFGYWEKVFSGLNEGEKGMPSLRDKLRNSPQTISALAEAEVISQLKRGGALEVEPTLATSGTKPDLRVDLTEASALLEVYRPSMERSLLFETGVHGINRAKIRAPIEAKIAAQYDATAGDLGFPLFLVMNLEETPYLDFMLPEFMVGTTAVSLRLNPSMGTAEIGGLIAQPDAMGETDERLNSISGVIAYRRDLVSEAPGKLVGRIYLNPRAVRPLDPEGVRELHRRFFETDPPDDEPFINTDP